MKAARILGFGIVLAGITAEALATGPGSVLSDKVRSKPVIEPAKPAKGSVLNDKIQPRAKTRGTKPEKEAKVGGVMIRRFGAKRAGDVIRLEAALDNTNPVASGLIAYSISSRADQNSSWKVLKNGQQKPIVAGHSAFVQFELPTTTKGIRFRLEISPASQTSAECELKPDISYFVRYTTSSNWINAKRWRDDLSNGFDASEMARLDLGPLGVQTRINKKKTPEFSLFGGGVYMRLDTMLQVRTTEKLEQTFATKVEAEKFRDKLVALVPDRGFTVEAVGERY